MAKVAEQYVIFKISKLVKDSEPEELKALDTAEVESLVSVMEEMVDDGCIVEIGE